MVHFGCDMHSEPVKRHGKSRERGRASALCVCLEHSAASLLSAKYVTGCQTKGIDGAEWVGRLWAVCLHIDSSVLLLSHMMFRPT